MRTPRGRARRFAAAASPIVIGSSTFLLIMAVAVWALSVVFHQDGHEVQPADADETDTMWQSPPADLVFEPRLDGYYTADTATFVSGADSGETAHRIYLRFYADGMFCAAADELGAERSRSSIMTSLVPGTGESSRVGTTHCDNRWQASALTFETDADLRRVELVAANDEEFLVAERSDAARSTVKTGYVFHGES